ncbi:MAG: type 1 glutamine amidotransferase [Candidatus Melainabacteria bacterium]
MDLHIAYLYPEELNIYGDRGNLLTLVQRCRWRGIAVHIHPIGPGEAVHPDRDDLYFMGGGQDAQQMVVCDDLHRHKAEGLKAAVGNGAVFLTICGGYQLLGHYYRPHRGPELRGLSLIDAVTVAGDTRFIGNVCIRRADGGTVTGFENHSGLTTLGPGVPPLGAVVTGHGNNNKDGTEGVQHENLYGTYLHGSLLPKNPALADELISRALSRRHGRQTLTPLDDRLENEAHRLAVARPA